MELNANPNRLDMDWRHIEYALQQNVLISINPDAHSIEGMDDIQYGIKVAQKAGVTKDQNLSSFSLAAFEALIARKKK
jgi:DNA polymerase (family 10)